ncbi:hypothetical protein NF27_CG01260 [Candidatus Jidaibacter acanthamoeba]|uniref:Uncharacterized protein n=1 Tax=Candidatus Jidaibacter acanthamoebae TaxID=86105 RepID=A0A0C1N0V4_9RICK|nr:hypothetical protein [Candidatus Jidaibacter acanthamoeba]KIE05946.1 hypothetical protein NF27_CG01260 [Candidatus Jidaibacter acanthamoeba]
MKSNYRELKRTRLKDIKPEDNKSKLSLNLFFKIKPRYAFLLISILVFTVIYFYSYKYTVKPVDLENLPLIKRDPSYLRIIPEDRGGIIFSNQDKEIYNSITPQNSTLETKAATRANQAEQIHSDKMSDLITKIQNAKDSTEETTQKPQEIIAKPEKLEEKSTQAITKPKEPKNNSKQTLERNASIKSDKKSLSSVFDVIEVDNNK